MRVGGCWVLSPANLLSCGLLATPQIFHSHCVQIPGSWVHRSKVNPTLFLSHLKTNSGEGEMHSKVLEFAFVSQGALA